MREAYLYELVADEGGTFAPARLDKIGNEIVFYLNRARAVPFYIESFVVKVNSKAVVSLNADDFNNHSQAAHYFYDLENIIRSYLETNEIAVSKIDFAITTSVADRTRQTTFNYSAIMPYERWKTDLNLDGGFALLDTQRMHNIPSDGEYTITILSKASEVIDPRLLPQMIFRYSFKVLYSIDGQWYSKDVTDNLFINRSDISFNYIVSAANIKTIAELPAAAVVRSARFCFSLTADNNLTAYFYFLPQKSGINVKYLNVFNAPDMAMFAAEKTEKQQTDRQKFNSFSGLQYYDLQHSQQITYSVGILNDTDAEKFKQLAANKYITVCDLRTGEEQKYWIDDYKYERVTSAGTPTKATITLTPYTENEQRVFDGKVTIVEPMADEAQDPPAIITTGEIGRIQELKDEKEALLLEVDAADEELAAAIKLVIRN